MPKPPISLEDQFSAQVLAYFQTQLVASPRAGRVQVLERVKILKDLTIGRDRDGAWRLIAGFQEQDIVFTAEKIKREQFDSPAIRIDKYAGPVIIPLAVCELKIGAAMNTHNLITYASISAQLKSIFPHCAYYFVLDSNRDRHLRPETLLRHTKAFDRVFVNWHTEQGRVWKALQGHFEYLGEMGVL